MNKGTDEVRGNRIAFRASDSEVRWLERTAQDLERSVSWVMRRLITDARREVAWPLPPGAAFVARARKKGAV